MPEPVGDVTRLLRQLRAGQPDAAGELVPLIYAELRRIAGAQMARERPGHTLQATAVVHEAYLRLAGEQNVEWQNRAHFFAIAARTMRRVLLDYARQRRAGRRGGDGARKVDFDSELLIGDDRLEEVVVLDEVLTRLSEMDEEQGRIVELRFFAGLNVEETAEAMGISPRTVKREWRLARAWLDRELAGAKPK
jgi:RNA polymerase sigma factor (TIGR02999 family)